jgi:hypothetical protein
MRLDTVTGPQRTIQGKVAGVTIRQDAGDGTEKVIQLRNPTSVPMEAGPQYIVDGVMMIGGMKPGSLDPSGIQSIEVIQGQRAIELYGASIGANGVIVIRTKKE